MGILGGILFGALAGWVASGLMGIKEKQGCLANVVIGVLGSILGGFIYSVLAGHGIDMRWNLRSFIVAVLGSVLLLAIIGKRKRSGS